MTAYSTADAPRSAGSIDRGDIAWASEPRSGNLSGIAGNKSIEPSSMGPDTGPGRGAATLPAVSRTFIICKPDAVERGYVGQILDRFERKGLSLVAGELRQLDEATLASHYAEHVEKPFYPDLVAFMSRSPAFLAVLEGPDDTYAIVRTMMGPTNPAEAPPGTIRGDYGTIMTENLVHGSDSNESAEREIGIFFPGLS